MRIDNLEQHLQQIPIQLQDKVKHQLDAIQKVFSKQAITLTIDDKHAAYLLVALASSNFIADVMKRYPERIKRLFDKGELLKPYKKNRYQKIISEKISAISDDLELSCILRAIRYTECFRIAFRDINQLADLSETLHNLSELADQCLIRARDCLHQWMIKDFGEPSSQQYPKQELVIIALGKLGTKELNFSSDVDLLFAYPEEGWTKHETNSISNERFFILLAQKILKVISSITEDGFVFRMDMRLRPFGSSGPLVIKYSAFEEYYRLHGRDWERYALAKARILKQNRQTQALENIIQAFVYRRYVDYGAIAALRKMKILMRSETHSMENDIKRGPGGIREVEFVVQTMQLIRGGKELWLQNKSIFDLLNLLSNDGLPQLASKQLHEGYAFLRQLEHRLQQYTDNQTQTLPADELIQARIAFAMNYASWDELLDKLNDVRSLVELHFDQTIAKPDVESVCELEPEQDSLLRNLIKQELTPQEAKNVLKETGFSEIEDASKAIENFQQSYRFRKMDEQSFARLSNVFPKVIQLVAQFPNQQELLHRVLALMEALTRRSIYFVLLLENPKAIPHLLELCSASPWIASQLTEYPFLLEELLNSKTLYAPFTRVQLEDELRQYLLSIPEDDLEQQMECLRRFKQIQVLRVAAADIKGVLPLMKVSDHLTHTASVIIEYAKNIAWRYLVTRHGYPVHDGELLQRGNFAIVAYGKLGGLELSYGSDLDIVFLHKDIDGQQMTDGAKAISNLQFFMRLAQRIIHILTTPTTMGALYQVDTRLRPSGASGLLVSGISSYGSYQQNQAWIWEHQALIRARMVSGSDEMHQKFETIRAKTLCKKRDLTELKDAVSQMREKMRESQKREQKDEFDIDQGYGGLKDIEFLVQYLILKHCDEDIKLVKYTDNIRGIDALEKFSILDRAQADLLRGAYQTYRKIQHHNLLQNQHHVVLKNELEHFQKGIVELWNQAFSTAFL